MNIDDLNINQFESDDFDDNHGGINHGGINHAGINQHNEHSKHDESDIELSYIDYLTSQYIDGELSNYEDYELRELITKDKDLKSSFDTSIDVYLTMKNDNIVEYDKKFFDETEDLLVAQLFGKEQEKVLQDISLEAFASPSIATPTLITPIIDKVTSDLNFDTNLVADNNANNNANNNTKIFNLSAFNQALSNGLKEINYRKISAVAAMLLVFLMSEISEFKNNNSIISFANLNYEVKFKDENINDLMIGEDVRSNNRAFGANIVNSIINPNNNNFASGNHSESNNESVSENNEIIKSNEIISSNEIGSNNTEVTDTKAQIETNTPNVNSNVVTSNATSNATSNLDQFDTQFDNQFDNQVPKQVEVPNTFMVTSPIAVDNRLNQLSLTENNPFDQRQKLQVKINSSMSSEFNNSFFTEKHRATIMHYSQSMAFEIDKTADIGFEIGYSDLNFDDKALITITKEIPNTTPGSNLKQYTTISVPVEMRKNYSLYWAMGFFEKQLIDYNDLDLMGKVGFGISNEGPQTYLRLNARYELFKEFYLTWGIDTRYMSVNLPLYENLGNVRSTTSFALNYGLQYKF